MLTAGELDHIQTQARGRFGVYLRLDRGPRFYDVVCVPDGITWLLRITSEKGKMDDVAIEGALVEETLCVLVDHLKKLLVERGAPS